MAQWQKKNNTGENKQCEILFHIPPGLIEEAGYPLQTPVRELVPGIQGRTPRVESASGEDPTSEKIRYFNN